MSVEATTETKMSSMAVSDIVFQKHVYGRQVKHALQSLKDFDPRPAEYRGPAPQLLEGFLKKVQDKGLGVSLLLDKNVRVWEEASGMSNECSAHVNPDFTAVLPSQCELIERVESCS